MQFGRAAAFTVEDFAGPLERLTGLPNQAYTSNDFALFERDRILARTWVCIGIGAHLKPGGWAQPVDLLGLPLLLLRDRKDAVRVFHNVCSHRGMRLVEDAGPLGATVTCRYHGWCYSADGALRSTPHIAGEGCHDDPDFDKAANGLTPVRCHIFADMIFVNLSGDAPPFEDFIAPVLALWSAFEFDRYRHGGAESAWRLDLAGNWKLAQENHVDGYHLPFVHPSLNSYSPLRDHYPLLIEGRASGQGTKGQLHAGEIGDAPLPRNPSLGEDWQQGRAEFLSIFPNVMMGVHADHVWVAYLLPQAADRTLEFMDLYYFEDGAEDPALADQRRNNRDRMFEIFKEDRMAVEGMQRGRASPAFTGGALSPTMDRPAHCFNRWMAGAIRDALDAE